MSETWTSALQLLGVGMTMVFLILSVLIGSAQLLIRLMNRLGKPPEEVPIPKEHLAVISAVSAALSKGQAKDIKVEKL